MVPAMRGWITNDNAAVATAWATFAGVAVAVLAATFALVQLRLIRKDSRERTRPYVQLDVVPGLQGPGSWDLVIENRGASTALNVVVDGGEYTPQVENDHIVPDLGKYLLAPKTLVPGARRRVMWGYSTNDPHIRAGVLDPRDVMVTYLDERHARSWLRRRDPHRALLNERDRVSQRPLPAGGHRPRTFPDRAGSPEMPVPGDPIAGPKGHRKDTMDHALEASTERVRNHLRRPHAPGREPLRQEDRRSHRFSDRPHLKESKRKYETRAVRDL